MPQRTPHVLVVDDNRDACANLCDILTDCGYAVATAWTGESGLDLLRESHFDAALLDLKLPGMNGVQLCREIKRLSAGTSVMILSAYASGESARQALAEGACLVLEKPVHLETLLPLLKNAVSPFANASEPAG